MPIRQILSNKKQYLDLLLLADESEEMIDNYPHPMYEGDIQLVDMIYLKAVITE
ncbi:MAG: hypothetical protein Q7262_01500 [Bacteroidales bacterium]|nr:hypothetical protein [Bacteroidales bacterium]